MPEVLEEEQVVDYWDFVEYIGPTWVKEKDGISFVKPKRTLGYDVLLWIYQNTRNKEKTGPFKPTKEQSRFLLWWYEVDPVTGKFTHDDGVIQRIKGWGKDPLVNILTIVEGFSDCCRFAGWAEDGKTPLTKGVPLPLVQVAATTLEQTSTTLTLYDLYMTDEFKKKHKIEINREAVKSNGKIIIQAVTKNPKALEGKTPTFVFCNETGLWDAKNSGHEMWRVIQRNLAKGEGGQCRVLAGTNAYDPSEDSVAQRTRESYEADLSNYGVSTILYDSIEALQGAPTEPVEAVESIIDIVRGDSKWSDLERLAKGFKDKRTPMEENRRFFYNTIVSSEGSFINIDDWKKCYTSNKELIEASPLKDGDEIVLFFDGSKKDDHTVLIASRVSDGLTVKLGHWFSPDSDHPASIGWRVPRYKEEAGRFNALWPNLEDIVSVEEKIEEVFKKYNPVALFMDPSHQKEDLTDEAYWGNTLKKCHREYGLTGRLKLWAGPKTGKLPSSVLFDMSEQNNLESFALHVRQAREDIMTFSLLHENDTAIRNHIANSKVYTTRTGLKSIWKGKKHSENKIDLAVGVIGARMVRERYLDTFATKADEQNYWDYY